MSLPGCFEPPPTAASMAICRPEASDAPVPRAGVKRRMAAAGLSWLPRGMAGGQGKKAAPPPLRLRRSRCQPSFGQIKPLSRVAARRTSLHRRRRGRRWLPRTRGPAFQAGRKKPWRADRTGCNPPEPRHLRRLSSSILPAGEIGADLSKPRECRPTAASGCRPGHPPIFSQSSAKLTITPVWSRLPTDWSPDFLQCAAPLPVGRTAPSVPRPCRRQRLRR